MLEFASSKGSAYIFGQCERCEYLSINQIRLGALSTQMLIRQNKQLILFLVYCMIILKCDVCYVTVYTLCQLYIFACA